MALLLLNLAIYVHRLGCVANLFDGKFDTADFQNVALLDFIVLTKIYNLR